MCTIIIQINFNTSFVKIISILANGTCLFKNNEPNVVSFYNDLEIREDVVEFPPGATIISRYFLKNCIEYFESTINCSFRCTDIGKFELVGSIERTCIHSEWTGTKPQCSGLNQENDYASRLLRYLSLRQYAQILF